MMDGEVLDDLDGELSEDRLIFFPSFGGDWCSLDAEFYWVDCSSDGSKERMFRVGTALQSQMLSGEITGHSEDK